MKNIANRVRKGGREEEEKEEKEEECGALPEENKNPTRRMWGKYKYTMLWHLLYWQNKRYWVASLAFDRDNWIRHDVQWWFMKCVIIVPQCSISTHTPHTHNYTYTRRSADTWRQRTVHKYEKKNRRGASASTDNLYECIRIAKPTKHWTPSSHSPGIDISRIEL